MKTIGYVVVEYNQASGLPDVVDHTFTQDRAEAELWAAEFDADTKARRRGEQHFVAEVCTEDRAGEDW